MFSFPEKKILSRNVKSDCIVLQLKEIGGKGLSNEDVKEALKQGVEIPRTIDSMKYSIFNILAATKFFFSEHSLLAKALIIVHNHVVKNRSIYISMHHQNKLFIGQFLFALDTRINLWLESCEECKFRDEVDDNLIDFSDLLQDVRIRNFTHMLPISIHQVIETSKESDEGTSPPSKRRKNNDQTTSDRIVNEGKIENWIKEDEMYNKCFRNGETLCQRPKLGNTIMCHRWNSKGYCFENCNNKASHIPSTELPAEAKKEYTKWVEKACK
jgi:hypothetical protein